MHKNEEVIIHRREMIMLRWIAGISMMKRRRHEDIKKEIDVLCLKETTVVQAC